MISCATKISSHIGKKRSESGAAFDTTAFNDAGLVAIVFEGVGLVTVVFDAEPFADF